MQLIEKFASSPTNAVEEGFNTSLIRILQNSIMTPATGPYANAPISAGSSEKSVRRRTARREPETQYHQDRCNCGKYADHDDFSGCKDTLCVAIFFLTAFSMT